MSDDEITLDELSRRTGVETRTLRSWVSEGLLSPPLKPGRGARYPRANADRALAVRALKDLHGLSFAEISRRFIMASDEEIRAWAAEAGPTVTAAGSARDYIKAIQAPTTAGRRHFSERGSNSSGWGSTQSPPTGFERIGRHEGELASLEKLILQLEKVLESPPPRRSRAMIWTRIGITPDLEISVRGDLAPRERVLFEQLADQLRAILIGRAKHD